MQKVYASFYNDDAFHHQEKSMSMTDETRARIDALVKDNRVLLFMKGERQFPQCGFSATAVQILDA